jgi:type VI secretion system protein ImpH
MKYSLFEEAFRFEFFRAVRVLERLYPDLEPIGTDAPPSREVARIVAHASLSFPASQIQRITPPNASQAQPWMTVNFMGLTGPLGALPLPYTEFVLERLTKKDYTLRDFLDIFNHRAIALFYRAWEKYHVAVGFERGQDDRFSQYLSDLIGMGTRGLKGRLAFEELSLLHYAGLFNQHPHSASGLAGIVRDFFEVPAEIEQFSGRRIRLEPENFNRLGVENTELGVNLILGESIWDRQSKFRVKLGALRFEEFRRFLPVGKGYRPLVQMTRLYAGLEYDFDVQLSLTAGEVPACRLASEGPEGVYLGWSSWLKVSEFKRNPEDTILSGDF